MSAATRILVVDDEVDFELLINQQFRRQIRAGQYTFSFARDGEQALSVLKMDAGFDLMLLDINMPVMDGLTLLARLRELQAPVRAIIVSAYSDMRNIRTAMNRGAFDFVTKPIDMADLVGNTRVLVPVGAAPEVRPVLPGLRVEDEHVLVHERRSEPVELDRPAHGLDGGVRHRLLLSVETRA